MTGPAFNPRARVEALGRRAVDAVNVVADGSPWSFSHLYGAAKALQSTRPTLAKRLHNLGAEWAVLHREVRA